MSCGTKKTTRINGVVVLMKKNALELNDFVTGIHDRLHELAGNKVSLQLVSSVSAHPANSKKGKVSKPAYLEDWLTKLTGLRAGESAFQVTFEWDEEVAVPGAFLIRNEHHNEFFLKTVTLQDVPGHGRLHFLCNSWVYPAHRYKTDRIFFSNKTYLPHQTPVALQGFREEELQILRGNGEGEMEQWDRVYDYACYNDVGEPDKGPKYARPILGGSTEFPYPRRGRTGRKPTKKDSKCESRLPLVMSLNIYVPRDERFGHLKLADFVAYGLKAVTQGLLPELEAISHIIPKEFGSFQEVMKLYEGGIHLPNPAFLERLKDAVPFELVKTLIQTDDKPLLKYPMPAVIKVSLPCGETENNEGWRTDEEFAREMLAGINPLIIRRLERFPPMSNLDPNLYGNQNSKIKKEDVENTLEGLTVDEALVKNKLFILDHHDAVMPYLRRINATSTKTYATRTLLFLQEDGTLKPVAIELSLPHAQGDEHGSVSLVVKPAKDGVEGAIWQLAKAYVGVNDSGYHQLNTHASIEPFVIATNRQLSVLHPIHRLLYPHFRDTMNINALARQTLINAEGIFELTVFPGKYALELSSVLYKNWVFPDQALPRDLLKRGMAVEDSKSPHGCRLLIEDYPYAVDGLEIWFAIKSWVRNFICLYYKSDDMIIEDTEIQQWWKEVREKGHGDKKDEPWWPKMNTIDELTEACTTIIWVASALHASVNFGQYPYGGFLPNRPTITRRLIPEPGTPEYKEMEENPDKAFLKTVTSQLQTLLGISAIEILSNHSSDEVYLGQRDSPEWTADDAASEAFMEFGKELRKIEENITERNGNGKWRNRVGPVSLPYTLLYPSSEAGLTGKGIPNSVSI
ncbi:hypothetical protein V2J09_022697 [Rumex salicifolius]